MVQWAIAGLKLHVHSHSGKSLSFLCTHNEACLLFHVRNTPAIKMGDADVFRKVWGQVK